MNWKTDVILSALFVGLLGSVTYYFLGGPRDKQIEQQAEAVNKSIKDRDAHNNSLLQAARQDVISLALDETTKNYYLLRLDEQAKGYFGGAGGAKNTADEARSRSKKP